MWGFPKTVTLPAVVQTDDFGELHALLHGAGGRYHSARAHGRPHRRCRRGAGGEPALRGLALRRGLAEHGHHRQARTAGPDDFYHDYEDPEGRARLWHERSDRWREEIYDARGRLEEAEVYAASGGPRWTYTRYEPDRWTYRATYMPELSKSQNPQMRFSSMLDPSEYMFSETFWDGTTVIKTSREMPFAGRECLEVLAEPVLWGYPPEVF